MRKYKAAARMRPYTSSVTCMKIASILLICLTVIFFLNWDMMSPPGRTLKFSVRKTQGTMVLVPIHPNATSNEELETRNVYEGHLKQYDLRVILIVYNRARSMHRLLQSLNKAEYYGDNVKLEVWIDRSSDETVDSETFATATEFKFIHGEYEVIKHPRHVSIFGQWLSTWKVSRNSSEICVILEDDLTVSPYFYKYLKLVHAKYDSNPEIGGYALQSVSINHGHGDSMLQAPASNIVFMYPVIGTWGFSPSPVNWANFIEWFTEVYRDKSFEPYVPGNVATDWYKTFKKAGKTDGMWSIWHIYYAWKNKEYTLYSNFENHCGLTVNWKEPGLHYTDENSKPSNDPLTEWRPAYEQLPDHPIHIDVNGNIEHT